jgi:hypothetical protein
MSGKQAIIGDICETRTPAGLAYIQHAHESKDMVQVVRVLLGFFGARPVDLAELVRQKELYFVFYRSSYAVRDHQAEIVSHQPVPEWTHPYPLMRWPGASEQSGKTVAWKLFRASDVLTVQMHQRTPVIRTLTPDQEALSVHQLWPHPVMVRPLGRGWIPERAEELRLQDFAEAKTRRASQDPEKPSAGSMRHSLYFPEKPKAEKAAERLRKRGLRVGVRKGADGEKWLAPATNAPPRTAEQMDEVCDEMEALATQFSGEYDGWEAEIDSLGPDGIERVN